jgi:hypothetical protein
MHYDWGDFDIVEPPAMTTFVILTAAADIIQAIQRVYPTDYFKLSDSEWFVADDGATAQEVHRKLAKNATGEQSKSTAVVCSIAGYYGVARKDLWEWLSAKGSAARHASST